MKNIQRKGNNFQKNNRQVSRRHNRNDKRGFRQSAQMEVPCICNLPETASALQSINNLSEAIKFAAPGEEKKILEKFASEIEAIEDPAVKNWMRCFKSTFETMQTKQEVK